MVCETEKTSKLLRRVKSQIFLFVKSSLSTSTEVHRFLPLDVSSEQPQLHSREQTEPSRQR